MNDYYYVTSDIECAKNLPHSGMMAYCSIYHEWCVTAEPFIQNEASGVKFIQWAVPLDANSNFLTRHMLKVGYVVEKKQYFNEMQKIEYMYNAIRFKRK